MKPPRNMATPPDARNCDKVSPVTDVATVAPKPRPRMATAAVTTHGEPRRERRVASWPPVPGWAVDGRRTPGERAVAGVIYFASGPRRACISSSVAFQPDEQMTVG